MKKLKLNRIKIVLAEKSITQKELSEHLNIGNVSVSRWCTNDTQPSLETLHNIAEFLKVRICDLIQEQKKPMEQPTVTK